MKALFFTALVNAVALSVAAPAAAQAPTSAGDLPYTAAFSAAIDGYRDCVMEKLEQTGIAKPDSMASGAVAACAPARDAVRKQLLTDILAAHPDYSHARVAATLKGGMDFIEPMMAQVAHDRAEALVGAAASPDAPAFGQGANVG